MKIDTPYVDIHTHGNCPNAITITTIGTHPYVAQSHPAPSRIEVTPQIEAIGEVGLDFSREVDPAVQERLFCEQLHLAQDAGLPVVIHSVRSFERVMTILSDYSLRAVIFHGFIGSPEQAQAALRRGYYLSFGDRTWRSPKSVRSLMQTPINRLFFETDESDTPIENIYERGFMIRSESIETLKLEIYNNYLTIFKR